MYFAPSLCTFGILTVRRRISIDQAISMQTSQIARNQFADGSDAGGEFFVVFLEFKVDRGSVPFSALFGKTKKVHDQTPAHSRKRQLFDQSLQVTHTVAKHLDNLYRDFWLLQAHFPKCSASNRSNTVGSITSAVTV